MKRVLRTGWLFATLAATAAFGLATAPETRAELATLGGNPLKVFVESEGNLQAQTLGATAFSFYAPSSEAGDGGFFIGFPNAIPSQNIEAGDYFGPPLRAGPEDHSFTNEFFGSVEGGVGAPFTHELVNLVEDPEDGSNLLEITQTIVYHEGAGAFRARWAVKNVSPSSISFRASTAADLYLEGSDVGGGFFEVGPPRFIGGLSQATRRGGGIGEVETSPWSAYQEAGYSTIWEKISSPEGPGFDNTFLPEELDNGAGVQWDVVGLAKNATKTFEVIWNLGLSGLAASPETAKVRRGATHTVSFAGADRDGLPFDGDLLQFTIAGANPGQGAVPIAAGQTAVSWVGNRVGSDEVTAYVDENGNGQREINEPSATATVEWFQAAPRAWITSGPRGRTTRRGAKLRFRSNEPGARFQCKLTAGRFSKARWTPCDSPTRYRKLGLGKKLFWVRAIKNGKVGRAARRGWTVVRRTGPAPLVIPATPRKAIFRALCPFPRPCSARVTIVKGKRALARGGYSIPARSSRKVGLRLTKAGRRALSKRRSIGAKATLVATRTGKRKTLSVILRRRGG